VQPPFRAEWLEGADEDQLSKTAFSLRGCHPDEDKNGCKNPPFLMQFPCNLFRIIFIIYNSMFCYMGRLLTAKMGNFLINDYHRNTYNWREYGYNLKTQGQEDPAHHEGTQAVQNAISKPGKLPISLSRYETGGL
jgi:hypothetical protein